MPTVKTVIKIKHKRKQASFSARKMRRMLKSIEKEPDNELKKLMVKTIRNAKVYRSKSSGRNYSKLKTNPPNKKISLLNYHN